MNKAFVREPDEPDNLRCPDCGAIGSPVSAATLAAHLPAGLTHGLGATACYCPAPGCRVGYFDAHGATVPADRLLHHAYPKSPDAPLCPCLGLTADDLRDDAERNDPTRIRHLLQHAEQHPEQCAAHHPAGRPCIAEAQKHYLRFRRA